MSLSYLLLPLRDGLLHVIGRKITIVGMVKGLQKAFVGAYGLLGERNHVRRVTLFSSIVHCNDEQGLLGNPHRTVFLHALNI